LALAKLRWHLLLAEEYHGQFILEAFEDNPYLPKFYEDNRLNMLCN
jgi:deoxyadenosine/deoxycytidine kinase